MALCLFDGDDDVDCCSRPCTTLNLDGRTHNKDELELRVREVYIAANQQNRTRQTSTILVQKLALV